MRNKTILTQSAWYHATSGEIFSDVLTYRLPLNLIFPTATQRDTPPDSLDIRGYHIFLQWILMRKSHMLQGNFLRLLQLELIQLIDGNKFTMKSDTAAVSAQRYVRTEYTWEGKIADLWHDWAWEQGTNYYNGERATENHRTEHCGQYRRICDLWCLASVEMGYTHKCVCHSREQYPLLRITTASTKYISTQLRVSSRAIALKILEIIEFS